MPPAHYSQKVLGSPSASRVQAQTFLQPAGYTFLPHSWLHGMLHCLYGLLHFTKVPVTRTSTDKASVQVQCPVSMLTDGTQRPPDLTHAQTCKVEVTKKADGPVEHVLLLYRSDISLGDTAPVYSPTARRLCSFINCQLMILEVFLATSFNNDCRHNWQCGTDQSELSITVLYLFLAF